MAASKVATSAFPLLPVLASRWSPRSFKDTAVPDELLGSLFEAARWSPSCFNDQPWRFIVTRKESAGFAKIADALVSVNQAWAPKAPVLVVSLAHTTFRHNGNPNRFAEFDVGQAVANLTVQAESLGLAVHQMGGFSSDKIVESFGLADKNLKPCSVFAIGYPGDAADLSDDLRAKEEAPRSRLPLSDLVFEDDIGTSPSFLASKI